MYQMSFGSAVFFSVLAICALLLIAGLIFGGIALYVAKKEGRDG